MLSGLSFCIALSIHPSLPPGWAFKTALLPNQEESAKAASTPLLQVVFVTDLDRHVQCCFNSSVGCDFLPGKSLLMGSFDPDTTSPIIPFTPQNQTDRIKGACDCVCQQPAFSFFQGFHCMITRLCIEKTQSTHVFISKIKRSKSCFVGNNHKRPTSSFLLPKCCTNNLFPWTAASAAASIIFSSLMFSGYRSIFMDCLHRHGLISSMVIQQYEN